jgi:hypothetical protein
MRIEFDASNETELTAVFVALAVLRGGDLSLPLIGDDSERVDIGGNTDVTVMPPLQIAEPPVAPPLPSAPVAPVATTPGAAPSVASAPSTTNGVQVDADGLPWDKRIHSTPAKLKADGRWRGRRGLDDATRDAVTAELKAAMAAPAAGPPPVVPPPMFEESAPGVPLPPTPTEPPADAATAFGAGGAAPVSSPPPAPVAPPPPAAPATPPAPPAAPPAPATPPALAAPAGVDLSAPAADFAGLMRKITALQTAGKLDVAGTTAIATSLGLNGVRDLMVRPDLVPSFDQLLPTA